MTRRGVYSTGADVLQIMNATALPVCMYPPFTRARVHVNPSRCVVLLEDALPQTCKTSRISIKRRRRDGVEGVARLELTERVGRVARPRDLLEPAAGGRGVAETTGGSTASSSSTCN